MQARERCAAVLNFLETARVHTVEMVKEMETFWVTERAWAARAI